MALRLDVRTLLDHYQHLLESISPVEAYALICQVEKVTKGVKDAIRARALKALEESQGRSRLGGITLHTACRVEKKYREKEVKAALIEAKLPESEVYEWIPQRVMNPSRVDQLVREGRLDARVIAPRKNFYIRTTYHASKESSDV